MLNFSTTAFAVGVESTSTGLRGASIILSRGKPKVEKIFEAFQPENGDSLLPYKDLLSNEKYLVSSGVKGSSVLVRFLQLPLTKDSDIETAVNFQVEPLLPYPIENALLASIRTGQQGQNTDLTVLAVRKDHLKQHLDSLQILGVEPEFVSCIPIAIARFSSLFETSPEPYIVIHLDEMSLTCALVKEGKLLTSYTHNQGVQPILNAFKEEFKNEETPLMSYDFCSIDSTKTPLISQAVESLRSNATKTIYAILKDTKGNAPTTLFLAGQGHLLNNLSDIIYRDLDMTVVTPKPNPQADLSSQDLLKFSIPIGLGINALMPQREAINFRKQEFTFPYPWKRLKKTMIQYAFLSLLLAVSFFIFSHAYLKYEQAQAKLQYLELLSAIHKPYATFEEEYRQKHPQLDENGDPITPTLEALTTSDLKDRLHYMQKDLKPAVDAFPFYPNVPRVSDVLAWVSTHPKVIGTGHQGDTPTPLIQIENFSYAMVKKPDQKQRQEKYQVKVELEFSSTAPKWAREFHDALIAPNDIVDPKGEVKWNANKGKYRTSFYLKDKTLYPI